MDNAQSKAWLTLVMVCTAASPAMASDWVDTRVTFTLADNDILAGPMSDTTASTTLPNSQPSSSNRLFFDDYERRDTGFENLSTLALYMKEPGYFEGLQAEAALVMRATVLDEQGVQLKDDGSYIRLTRTFESSVLTIDAFPISADRFRLGYSYDLSWGGSSIFQHSKAAPGVRLRYASGPISAFVGAKTGLSQVEMEDGSIEAETLWGVLLGAAIDVADEVRLEAGGGYFYRGSIPKDDLKSLRPSGWLSIPQAQAFGGSTQLTYHIGMPIGVPIDFRVLKNDPAAIAKQLKPEKYGSGTSFVVRSEASFLGQTLQDADRPHTTVIQNAVAADVTSSIKIDRLRIHGLLVYRDLAFLLFNTPSLQPYVDFPSGGRVEPEVFASVTVDYYFDDLRLTPGLTLGAQRPANFTSVAETEAEESLNLDQQTMIIYPQTDGTGRTDSRGLLDPGEDVQLVLAAKLTMRWDLSPSVSLLGDLSYSYDANRRFIEQSADGYAVLSPGEPNIVGFNLLAQARF